MWLFIKRVFKFACQDFFRKRGLTVQAVFITSVALLFISTIFFLQGISSVVIKTLEERVDIAVYFTKETAENDILEIRRQILAFDEVELADYISSEDALDSFLQKHKNDRLYLTALAEIEENPFLSSIGIKAEKPDQYEAIVGKLETSAFASHIDRVTYNENKLVIERLYALTKSFQRSGFIGAFIFAILVILILFNTTRLAILSQKDEIITSRLAGAGSWFTRGPFLAQTIFYSMAALVLVNIVIVIFAWLLNGKMANWFVNFYLLDYFKMNFFKLLLLQISFAFPVGLIASTLAIRKYLRI